VIEAAGVPAPVSQGRAPSLFAHLVDRAASMLRARAAPTADFSWWDAGEESTYIGRLEWHDEAAPRVVVYDGRTGDFICRSTAGDCFAVDTAECVLPGGAPDELQRYAWLKRARVAIASGRSAPHGLCALADEMALEAAMQVTAMPVDPATAGTVDGT
jgi:hypothetical protein